MDDGQMDKRTDLFLSSLAASSFLPAASSPSTVLLLMLLFLRLLSISDQLRQARPAKFMILEISSAPSKMFCFVLGFVAKPGAPPPPPPRMFFLGLFESVLFWVSQRDCWRTPLPLTPRGVLESCFGCFVSGSAASLKNPPPPSPLRWEEKKTK